MTIPDKLSDLPYAEWLRPPEGPLLPDGDHDTTHFDGVQFADVEAPGSRFLECAFTGVTFDGGSLRRARLLDVWADGLRLIGTDLGESEWQEGVVCAAVAAGVSLAGAVLSRVVFRRCKIDAVNFRDAALTGVVFEDCLLREVDFGGASLTATSFRGSRLSQVSLARARFDRADLRGAELGISIEPTSLRGIIVSPAQLTDLAPLLAEALGITVEEERGSD